jgi:hypothetical protein
VIERGFALTAAMGLTAFALAGGALSGCQRAPAPQGALTPAPSTDSAQPPGGANATAGNAAPGSATPPPDARRSYSPFGSYQRLPSWSTWCGLQPDGTKCAAPLTQAVQQQTAQSRPTVRGHGWHLWSAIWAPIPGGSSRNDPKSKRTNLYGTTGCWAKLEDGKAACSGFYPIWMTWPNNGRPHGSAGLLEATSSGSAASAPAGQTLRSRRRAHGAIPVPGDPNPTRVQTVNTKAPTYALPPLTLSKQCGLTTEQAKAMLAKQQYPQIEEACKKAGAPGVFCPPQSATQAPAICDGSAFVDQGDVMIATESLSAEAFDDIRHNELDEEEELKKLYAARSGGIGSKIGSKFISTKHMFWPVKGCRPGAKVGEAGCRIRYGALPPWVPRNFKSISYSTNADYLGYEQWKSVVAIDTCKSAAGDGPCPPGGAARLALEYVTGAQAIVTQNPKVYGADDFLHIQISEEVLKSYFTATDRALLDQAMIWAYGDKSNGFEPGDFLVVAAMHVNTKELPSWALQSVWWSPMSDTLSECPLADFNHCFGQAGGYAATAPGSQQPNEHSGLTTAQIGTIDGQVGTGWRDHYLLTDSYGINFELDGTPVTASNYFKGQPPAWATTGPSGQALPLFPVSCNVYIEPVIHPLGTDCQNCHRRAGYPDKNCAQGEYAGGCGRASYQTAQCASLLGDYGSPQSDLCMTQPWAWHDAKGNHCKALDGTLCANNDAYPVLDTDWIWLIADLHAKQPPLH